MPYTHLLSCIVHAHQLALALVGGTNIAIALRNGDFGHATLEFGKISFYSFAEKGILITALSLEDPFGNEAMDFPRLFYHTLLEKIGDIMIIFGTQHSFPSFQELLRKQTVPDCNDDRVYDWDRRNYAGFFEHACN